MTEWRPIETAPKGDDDYFLVCGVDDERSPFVVRGSILKSARRPGTPSHLHLHYLTHWMSLPPKPGVVLQKRPAAYRYKNGADQWVYTEDEAETQVALNTGHDAQGLYVRDGT